jgi:DNA-binding transcriptional ArsR family regulator
VHEGGSEAQPVARLARVLSHETCVRLVDELTAGEASVTELCCRLELDQPRVSSHLSLLREAGLVEVESQGRQRIYALRGESPGLALATLRTLAAGVGRPASEAALRAVRDDAPVRQARTCYDHLAGVAGVRMLEKMLERGWLVPHGERAFLLTSEGGSALEREGMEVGAARRARRSFAIGCSDWTERRPHLGGALGATILAGLLRSGRAQLAAGSRVVRMAGDPWPA